MNNSELSDLLYNSLLELKDGIDKLLIIIEMHEIINNPENNEATSDSKPQQ